MFGVGAQEIILIGALYLAVFGPKRTVEMAKESGRFVAGLRKLVDEIGSEISFADFPEPTDIQRR